MPISLQDAQQVFTDQGLRTQYGLILPPGCQGRCVCSLTGIQSGDDAFLVGQSRGDSCAWDWRELALA